MCASLSEVELIQTPINNEQQGDNPVSEEQNRNAEFSPSARLDYLFVLLSEHHIINACNGIGDKAPLVFSLRLKAYLLR
jgi:hypothetical protein